MSKKKKRLIISLSVVAVVIIAIVVTVVALINKMEKDLEYLKNLEFENIDLTQIEDNTYFGSYSAAVVSAEVKVTVTNHAITNIEIVKHDNGKGAAAEAITGDVIEAQSLEVDAISGATHSSIVILKAIENALLSALN